MDPHFSALGAFLSWLLSAIDKGAFGKLGSQAVERLAGTLSKVPKISPDAEANARRRARTESVARRLATKQAKQVEFMTAKFISATEQLLDAKDEIRKLEGRIKQLEQHQLVRDIPISLPPASNASSSGIQPNGAPGSPSAG